MPKCGICGKKFDVADARREFDADDKWAGELTYDELIPERSICGLCAIAVTVENLGAGRAPTTGALRPMEVARRETAAFA